MRVHIPKFPHKLEELLGRQGTDEVVDFLNEAFYENKEDVVQVVGDKFDRRITEESSKLRAEIGGLRIEMKEMKAELKAELKGDIFSLRSELKEDIGSLRSELKEDIGSLRSDMERGFTGLHREIAGIHKEISGIHKDNSSQTKWLLAVFLAAGILYPLLNQLMIRFAH